MCAILPIYALNVYEAKINLVNKGGRLEGVSGLFGGHIPLREPMQLVINQRHKFLEGLFVS